MVRLKGGTYSNKMEGRQEERIKQPPPVRLRLDHVQPALAVVTGQHAVVGVAPEVSRCRTVHTPVLLNVARQTDCEIIAFEVLRLITAPIERVISEHLLPDLSR